MKTLDKGSDPDANTMPRCDIEDLQRDIDRLKEQVTTLKRVLLRECPKYEDWINKHFGDK